MAVYHRKGRPRRALYERDVGPTTRELRQTILDDLVVQGRADSTHRDQSEVTEAWCVWLEKQDVFHVSKITTSLCKQYLIDLRQRPNKRTGGSLSDLTVTHHAVILTKYMRRAYEEKLTTWEILYAYKVPRAKDATVYLPESEDCANVFAAVDAYARAPPEERARLKPDAEVPTYGKRSRYWSDKSRDFYRVRLRAILAMQISTGLRIGETCKLTLEDYDPKGGEVIARKTKNGHDRAVTIPDLLRRVLAEWMRKRPKSSPTNYSFVTENIIHRTCPPHHLVSRSAVVAARMLAIAAGIWLNALSHHQVRGFVRHFCLHGKGGTGGWQEPARHPCA